MTRNLNDPFYRLYMEFVSSSGGEFAQQDAVKYVQENLTEEDLREVLPTIAFARVSKLDKELRKPLPASNNPKQADLGLLTPEFLTRTTISTDGHGGRKTRARMTRDDQRHCYIVKAEKASQTLDAAERELLKNVPGLEALQKEQPQIILIDALKMLGVNDDRL